MEDDVRELVCGVTGTVGQDRFAGPLGPLEAVVRGTLAEEGFAPQSARYVIDRMRRLSGWMERRSVEPCGLTPEAVAEFLSDSRELKTADRGLGTLLRLLRSQSVIPPEHDSAGGTAAGMLMAQYRDYLAGERGLAAESVRCYLVQGRKLVDELGEPVEEGLRQLDAAAVTSFIMRQARQCTSTWSAKTLVTATRSLLRFLHVKGLITAPLAGVVPAVAGWRLSALPRGLEPAQVEAILAVPDPGSRSGLRDRAILMLLARLGLRGAEAAGLQLADIDWQAGEITVTGKGAQTEAMPLPADAGQALADYLTKGRPRCSLPAVFVTARAPYHQITPSVVRALVPRACEQAGLPRAGAHRLRHSLATGILRAGAPLSEVGQLLRHRSQLSTSIYAKIDYARLALVARPWPLPAGTGAGA
jgi:site-specific recombinase XerD